MFVFRDFSHAEKGQAMQVELFLLELMEKGVLKCVPLTYKNNRKKIWFFQIFFVILPTKKMSNLIPCNYE